MYFNPSMTLVFEFQLLASSEGLYMYGTLKYIYDFTFPEGW